MSRRIAATFVAIMIEVIGVVTAYAAAGVLHTQWSCGLVKGEYQEPAAPPEEDIGSSQMMGDVIISEPIRIIDLMPEMEEADEAEIDEEEENVFEVE